MSVFKKLIEVQSELKAPKSQYNNFGKYSYRSCEDILEALKPILLKVGATIMISDEMIIIGERYYVKATVKFIDTETGEMIEVSANAREEEQKKGMDSSQLTGSTSSYARKYALNGMFAIDDTKDSDATNTHGKENDLLLSIYKLASKKGYSKEVTNKSIANKGLSIDKFDNRAYETMFKALNGLEDKK